MWQQNQPGAQFMAHWKYGEKRQLHFLQFHVKPQNKLIMIITTFINSLSHNLDFLTLPPFLRPIFSSALSFFPPLSPTLSRFTRIRGNKNIITSSQAGNCSHVFWTIMGTVLCLDPWKRPAVKSKVREEGGKCQRGVLHAHLHVKISVYVLVFVCVCVCVWERNRATDWGEKGVRLSERGSRNLLWYLNDYNESLSSRSAHCCDLIWFLSDAEMLHYQVGSKLCLNQLQWDPVRPSGHRGPSGRGWGRMEAGMREGYDRVGFWGVRGMAGVCLD